VVRIFYFFKQKLKTFRYLSRSPTMIRRRGIPVDEDSSEDEASDIFSNLGSNQSAQKLTSDMSEADQTRQNIAIVPSVTSSMKRHHTAMTNSRKKQMDSLLQELEREKSFALNNTDTRSTTVFVPNKRGSYVEPSEEHLTTNLFVGNVAPTISEEAIAAVFSKFGELVSLKVMWPRTPQERERNRVSCFVCYRYRRDAEAAMEACSEADPFNVGRRLMVRWGKNLLPQGGFSDDALSKRRRLEQEEMYHEEMIMKSKEIQVQEPYPSRFSNQGYKRYVDGGSKLDPDILQEFHSLTSRRLSLSRQSICDAMAFCFEHSNASTQISELLKELLLQKSCSIDTHVARLYLISDVLFNSQQPGIKNAFRYRDAIEKMSPAVFACLGQHGEEISGRMTRHKIEMAVQAVLAAWTKWGVFDALFIDELEACFRSRDIVKLIPLQEETLDNENLEEEKEEVKVEEEIIILSARGDWTEVDETDDYDENEKPEYITNIGDVENNLNENETGYTASQAKDDDIDGEPLEEGDLDEDGLQKLNAIHQVTDSDDDENESYDTPVQTNAERDTASVSPPSEVMEEGDELL
jgi:RNA recognition motif-containing protein